MCREGQQACDNCLALAYCTPLNKAQQRAALPAAEAAAGSYNNAYLTLTQAAARIGMHISSRDQARLHNLNMLRKLASAVRALSMSRKLILALAQHDIPRVHQLLSVQLREHRSVPAILDKLAMAVEGNYAAKVSTSPF
jgi:hypothetical protein